MNTEVSCSKTLPPQPPQPTQPTQPPHATSSPSTRLAPGFRFHPTDEELVSYYLKRKVTGRPIRVDAISEVDLYKIEPWDLPPYSRMHSRDLEWYFFTGLDRKYSNRSRTNRATKEGYWKTTGKDRPVLRRSRTIGMKKTLVYHAGRAPRGQRTNWVMHEYRLEDEDLLHTGIPQDGYVLCRVFQKSGPGPQNGAQYGAPYEEEEWERYEEDDSNLVPGNDAFIVPANEDFVHLTDFLQNQDATIHHFDAFPLAGKSTEQDVGWNAEGSFSMDDILKDKASVEDFTEYVDFPVLEDNSTGMNGFRENSTVDDQSNDASIQNNAFVQLKDLVGEENTCFTSNGCSNDHLLRRHDDISVIDGVGYSEKFPVKHVSGNLLDTNGVSNLPDPLQICPVQHDMYLEPYDLCDDVPSVHDSAKLAEDNLLYYDVLGHGVQYLDSFTNEASLAPRAEFDFLEELMAYYDATDDTLHHATTDSFVPEYFQLNSSHLVQSSSSTKAVGSCTSSEAVRVPKDVAKCALLGKASNNNNNNNTSGGSSGNLLADIQQKDPQGTTLMKRLASVLESISAPPAFAAEPAITGKMPVKISEASTSSFHVTAGMIQIQNSIALGCSENWAFPKHGESAFLFSYGMNNKVISKSDLHEPRKAHCGFFSSIFRGGLHSFLLSSLMLALGVFVYNL